MSITPSRKEWNAFVASRPHVQFLQSYEWGEFQKSIGRNIEYVSRFHEGALSAVALIIRTPLGGGYSYLYCPRGPIGLDCTQVMDAVATIPAAYPNNKRILFARIELPQECEESLRKSPTKKAVSTQPEVEWIVDLKQSHEHLLLAMHPKTRYNIRLAQKKDIRVRVLETKQLDLEDSVKYFLSFLSQTAAKKSFRLHDEEYYKKLIHFFVHPTKGPHNNDSRLAKETTYAVLYEAKHEGKIVGTILVIYFGDTATYLHGGSSYKDRELMAPYALHEYAMRDAASRGYSYYNFGGITLDPSQDHPWAGITRFKKSFGGESLKYSGTYDYILNSSGYMIYEWGRTVRRFVGRFL